MTRVRTLVLALGSVAAALVACGDAPNSAGIDAAIDASTPPPLRYKVYVRWWPFFDPLPDPHPTIYIDGAAREELDIDYSSAASATDDAHLVELRYGGLVVASRTLRIGSQASCLADVPDASEASVGLCAIPTGELRFLGEDAWSETGSCNGDAFCPAACVPAMNVGCSGTRCTSIYASLDPVAAHLGCAPAGPKLAGEACSLMTSYAGIHDNCGSQLVCVEGTCRQACNPYLELPAGCTTCSHVAGQAPEVFACE